MCVRVCVFKSLWGKRHVGSRPLLQMVRVDDNLFVRVCTCEEICLSKGLTTRSTYGSTFVMVLKTRVMQWILNTEMCIVHLCALILESVVHCFNRIGMCALQSYYLCFASFLETAMILCYERLSSKGYAQSFIGTGFAGVALKEGLEMFVRCPLWVRTFMFSRY